jgi:uncharacterized coiled-coil DUF342 family protein
MSSFFDKAKEKAQQIAGQVKDKVEDVQDRRKADDLLDDLGRIVYRQRTAETASDDEARIAELVSQLQALEAAGTAILDEKGARDGGSSLPPPSAPSDLPPPTV